MRHRVHLLLTDEDLIAALRAEQGRRLQAGLPKRMASDPQIIREALRLMLLGEKEGRE